MHALEKKEDIKSVTKSIILGNYKEKKNLILKQAEKIKKEKKKRRRKITAVISENENRKTTEKITETKVVLKKNDKKNQINLSWG